MVMLFHAVVRLFQRIPPGWILRPPWVVCLLSSLLAKPVPNRWVADPGSFLLVTFHHLALIGTVPPPVSRVVAVWSPPLRCSPGSVGSVGLEVVVSKFSCFRESVNFLAQVAHPVPSLYGISQGVTIRSFLATCVALNLQTLGYHLACALPTIKITITKTTETKPPV